MKKFTYEVRLGFEPGAIIGWRKTLKGALVFAKEIVRLRGKAVIVKRDRLPIDFCY